MSCDACRGYSCACPCCGEDDGEPSCGGEGAGWCDGCEDCVKEVRRTTVHTARKAHHGLLVGDRYSRTVGFDYQIGGGRTYVRPVVQRVARGPNHPAVLVETGVLPAVAQERAALTARFREVVQKVEKAFGQSVEEAEAVLAAARAVVGEVDAFVALHDANNTLRLRSCMTPYRGGEVVKRAETNLARSKECERARKAEAARKARAAEWQATGGDYKAAGGRVTFEGREYVLGETWTKWVAHSNLEYMGESVDGEVVWGRDLLDPETGKVALRWSNKREFPTA